MATKTKNEQQTLGGGTGTGLATTTQASTGLATMPQSADDLALAGLFDGEDIGDDGLSEIGGEDLKIPLKVWNMKGVDATTKRKIPEDVFYDTVTETTTDTLDLVLLDLRKTNEWRSYIEAEKKSVIHCRSNDRVRGEMTETHEVRDCATCPDAQWKKDEKGKPTKNCGAVYSVAALDTATSSLCLLRFKKTSLNAIKSHLNKNHLGRRVLPGGKRGNWPLFAFTVRARLRMDEGGVYSHIELERTGICTAELLRAAVEAKSFFSEFAAKNLDRLAEKDLEAGGEQAADTSFDPAKLVVDAKGESTGTAAAEENLGFADQ